MSPPPFHLPLESDPMTTIQCWYSSGDSETCCVALRQCVWRGSVGWPIACCVSESKRITFREAYEKEFRSRRLEFPTLVRYTELAQAENTTSGEGVPEAVP
jgi:hypothetical protein